jgi:hypothetical protein
MWARPDESSEYLIGWYHRACAHADETIRLLDLDAPGQVPWWTEGHRTTTLGATMIRVLGEENSHGGHLAITRELIDGRADDDTTTFATPDEWKSYVAKVQAAADHFA